jgi:hypothetical protein
MADVLYMNDFRPCALNEGCTDGGKARILRRRASMRMRIDDQPKREIVDDLIMDHVDTSPCEMAP